MKIEEIISRRIQKKQQVFEILVHEISAEVYNSYRKLRTASTGFSLPAYIVLPRDSIYEYIDMLKSIHLLIQSENIRVPQCVILLNDLLEYLDDKE